MVRSLAFLAVPVELVIDNVPPYFRFVQGSKSNDGDPARASIRSQRRRCLEAVASGHRNVHRDRMRKPVGCNLDGLSTAVGQPALDILKAKIHREGVGGIGVVVHYQNAQPFAVQLHTPTRPRLTIRMVVN
jgi:hypothetical protein